MKKTNVTIQAMLAVAFFMVNPAAQADTGDDAAIAKARQEYETAMQGNDVTTQRIKKLQLAALEAKAEKKSNAANATVEMPALAKELNCVACHAIDKKVVGPAWRDVANRYTGQGVTKYTYEGKEYPLIEGLVLKVSKGGKGNWGTMPMPANDPTGVKKDKITELVKFEQSLANK
jgi:cytochrome c